MSSESKNKTPYIVAAVIVALVLCAFIPYQAWDCRPYTNRYCVEGSVSSINGNQIKVNIETSANGSNNLTQNGAYVVLEGTVPSYCKSGQSVAIAIPKGDSLLDKNGKKVEVSLYRDTSVLVGMIIPMVAPFRTAAPSMTLKELNLNGSKLVYYETSDK